MIIEELQKEVDDRSNKLVIENIASLLERPWYVEEDIDGELKELVNDYRCQLQNYICAKLELHRAKKNYDIYDWNEKLYHLTHNVRVKKNIKNITREDLRKNNINYKKYHTKCPIYS